MALTSDLSFLLDDMMAWAEDQGVTLKLFERADGAWEIVTLAITPDSAPGALRAVFVRLARSADEHACFVLWEAASSSGDLHALGLHLGFEPTTDAALFWKRAPSPTSVGPRPRQMA
jgi:hypothetical protein